MKLPIRVKRTADRLKHLALAVAVGATFLTGNAIADTTITSGNTFTIDNSNTTVVGTVTTWNDTGNLTIEAGATLVTSPGQNRTVANNDAIVLAGTAGTITMRFNDNDTDFQLNGASITSAATATGPQTLAIFTGVGNNGDRESVTFNAGIPNVFDSTAMSLNVTFNTQGSPNWVNLNAVNTFTGPITLAHSDALTASGILTIGGTLTQFNGNTFGSGTLNSGSYPGAITLGARTILNYASSAAQTLSGAISGAGAVQVTGSGILTVSGINTYSGNTTVKTGSSLVLADNGGMTFKVTNSASNKITGAGSATLDGDFTINTSAVTVATGAWVLVDTTTKSFTSNFTMAGAGWSEVSNIWTKTEGGYTWTFTEADGTLRVSGSALLTSFGIPGYAGVIDYAQNTVKLVVPKGTDFAALAPTFTVSSGTVNQTSGAVPSPTFAAANPVTYTVTDTATNPATVRPYAVTVITATGIINVSAENSSNMSNPAELTGPAGGLGETWNQVTVNNASGLLDSVGITTTVGFTVNTDGLDYWNAGSLRMLRSGLRNFGKGTTNLMTFSGLTAGDRYDVYVASTQGNAEAGKGEWSTPNASSSVGAQSVDSSASVNTTTWVQGNNYILLENVVVDANGKIILNGLAAANYRLPVNGFQLVPVGKALFASFGIPGAAGVIDKNAKTIALKVPFVTDLATLAPTFTLTSGTANQTSGSPPSPTFASANPVHYIVTDTDTDPATVNDYTVTVTKAPALGTLVIDLGTSPAGTKIEGGTFGTYVAAPGFPTHLPLPSLPAGSILRSIAVNAVLSDTNNNNWASDLAVLLDPTPGTPGGDFSLKITNGDVTFGGAALSLGWPSTGNDGIGTALVDTKSEADWLAVGPIDLGTTGLFLGNALGGPITGGTWSGTITLTYDLVVAGSDYDTWAAGFLPKDVSNPSADFDGDGQTNGQERIFGLNPTNGASVNPFPVPLAPGAGTLSYTRRDTALTGLVYTVWTSPDLANWTKDVAASAGQVPSAAVNQVQTVAVTLSATPINGKLFVQIRAN